MKKIIFVIFGLLVICSVNLFATVGRQDYSTYFIVYNSTSNIINVSSSTYTTSSYENELKGAERLFHNESDSVSIKFQRGGSTATIITNGMTLEPKAYYVDDTYMGDIYFQAIGGNAELSISKLEKK